jgi:hypothetical protein
MRNAFFYFFMQDYQIQLDLEIKADQDSEDFLHRGTQPQ